MKTEEIKQLIERYLAAETSRHEEQLLQNYFSQADPSSLHPDLRPYAVWFSHITAAQQEDCPAELLQPKPKTIIRSLYLKIAAVAASIALIAYVAFSLSRPTEALFYHSIDGQTLNDQTIAIQTAEQHLEQLSRTLQKLNTPQQVLHKLPSAYKTAESALLPLNSKEI